VADATEVVIPYAPRPLQLEIHDALDRHRFGVVVCHRRFGKTVMAINHLIKAALTCERERPRFGYVGPTYRQAKAIAWDYLKFYSRSIPGCGFNESELRVDYPNGAQVRLYGADNPDALRGIYLDGVVLDEFGLMQGKVWSEVLRPALSDRKGWALFIGTPNGKNAFWEMRDYAEKSDGWYLAEHKASTTGVVDAGELKMAQDTMSADEYAQEFECSFEASVRGAVFAKEMSWLRETGRVKSVPWEPLIPVHTAWDLGMADSTAIWFIQMHNGEARVIDYYEASGEALGHYANVLGAKPYTWGKHILPHDAQVRELGTGRSRLEILQGLGIRATVGPPLPLHDGIEAARQFLRRCWFDADKCKQGIECLQNYRREENSKTGDLKAEPVHDWASHGADALRYAAISLKESGAKLAPLKYSNHGIY
jgi:phage terminase large subunit